MLGQILQPEIKDLIDKRDFASLREVLEDWSPTDLAELITDLEVNEQAILFRILHKELATDTFEYLELDTQFGLLKALGNEEVVSILNEMSPDDRTAMLEELPAPIAKQLIAKLSPEERVVAQKLLGYPEYSVGRLMTPDYIAVKEHWSVSEVLSHIREYGKDSETLNIIYVIDERGKLIDDIRIRDFLLAPLADRVVDLMDGNYISLTVTDDQEHAVEVFKKYDRIALPVTDATGILIGIVTIDDVLDVAEEEATEDIHKLGAVEALEEPYVDISLWEMMKKRAPWLSILFLGEMLTASAMHYFEDVISRAVVLTLFIPLIISSGGNSGSQTATLVIRSLSLGELKLKNWFFVFKRELFSGLILGGILGTLGFLRILIWQYTSAPFGEYWLLMGMTIGFSLLGVVMWGTITGSMLPLLLKRIGLDPATSSAPFVATLVDVTGIIIYFSMAFLFLGGILL
ncbi:MAG TPA: magnesium transporter [Ignavibacteriaceae bacterium]|jgi:magnesium transporter|nr:magnesium transporter [Ignavibacteriaceae bacterium]HOJ18234.1 magnesium transporter [Ignavibacteriaceae bacterium]